MASFMGQGAANAVFGDIQREWTQAVGGIRTSPSQQPEGPQIDWANFNYPPCLRLMHYDTAELPSALSNVVRPLHWLFLLTIVNLVVNFADSIALAAGGVTFFRVVYSFLDIVIVIPAAGFTFYKGYKALATSKTKRLNWYLIYQGVMGLLYLFFTVFPYGSINGLAVLGYRNNEEFNDVSSGIKNFWMICAIYESVLWFLAALLAAWNIYRAKSFNPYHSQEARNVQ